MSFSGELAMRDGYRRRVAITQLLPWQLDRAWPALRMFVRRAVERDPANWSVDLVYDWAQSGDLTLWLSISDRLLTGFCGSSLHQYPEQLACRIWIAGGIHMRQTVGPMLLVVETWARANGCQVVEITGRRGWKRVLAPLGYEHVMTGPGGVVLSKEMSE